MQINNVPVSKLSEHKKASKLIPMMTSDEWIKFIKSIKESGIHEPIHINEKYEVLDGRHRLKAAKELEIETLQVIKHTFTDDEEIKFVRDTAIERRNLTPAQRLNIVLETEEVINSIYAEGRKKMSVGGKKKKVSSMDESREQPHNSVKKIAEMAKVSKAQVNRIKKLKKENPDAYKEVVEGNKSLRKSYNELPTVVNKQAKKEIERGDADVNKEEITKPTPTEETEKKLPNKPKKSSNLYNFQNPEITKEEMDKAMFSANIETLFMHLREIHMFVNRNDNHKEIIRESIEKDKETFNKYLSSLEEIIKHTKKEEVL